MQTVVYDGSFYGLFTAIFEIYEYRLPAPDIRKEGQANASIFNSHIVAQDDAKAQRVIRKIQEKISKDAFLQLYRTWLSELPGIENFIFRYIQYALQQNTSVENDHGHDAVRTIHQTAKKVGREKHRMEAFIRFHKTKDELYYAIVEPDFNVLPLISKHFENRYADQRWLIYDATRKYGLYYDLQTVEEVQIGFSDAWSTNKDVIHDEQEDGYQLLWKQYFNSVNIQSRKNTKLHIRHVPRRYWKNLVEKYRNVL